MISILLMIAMVLALSACSSTKLPNDNQTTKEKIVNIGVTDSLASVNPLLMDATEILKYAVSLEFLPLVELNKDLEFEGMLASSITTEDNIHFTVTIDEAATWSDGTPVTAEDVVFTVLKLASPKLGNVNMALYAFEGIGDDGFVEEGATEIAGVKAIDAKTVEFTTKYQMALTTFQNTYGRYILTVPKHILEDVTDEALAAYEWFETPTVVNGPYRIVDHNLNHYVSYVANENYWKGTPKVDKVNINIVPATQLLTGLQSGAIDFVQQTTGSILQEDYEGVEQLSSVNVHYGAPVTNQSIFFNVQSVDEVLIRQAILYGIDRNKIVEGFLNGKGEVVDGFLSSASPFYHEGLVPTPYDQEKATLLVEQAKAKGWDATKPLNFYVNSGDTTFIQAAEYIAATLLEVGITIQVNTVDLSTLLTKAGTKDFDLLAIQYTYAPVDAYPDIQWLLSEGGWTGYENAQINDALVATQTTSDIEAIAKEYLAINTLMQQEVPMISCYVISGMGAVSERLQGATPDVYGAFMNIHEWDLKE